MFEPTVLGGYRSRYFMSPTVMKAFTLYRIPVPFLCTVGTNTLSIITNRAGINRNVSI